MATAYCFKPDTQFVASIIFGGPIPRAHNRPVNAIAKGTTAVHLAVRPISDAETTRCYVAALAWISWYKNMRERDGERDRQGEREKERERDRER